MLPGINWLLLKVLSPTVASRATSTLAVTAALLLGFLIFLGFGEKSCTEEADGTCALTAIDAIYLTVVTISTVGCAHTHGIAICTTCLLPHASQTCPLPLQTV